MNRRVLGGCVCRGVALTLLALAMPALGDSRGDLNSASPVRYVGVLDPDYATRSLQGPWIFEALELPGYEYIIFDGKGGVADLGAFCFQSGTYLVQSNGAPSTTVASPQNEFCDSGTVTIYGMLTSPTTGTLNLPDGLAQMRKVNDPSLFKGDWEGVLTEAGTEKDYPVTFSVSPDGSITSFIGFSAPVTGSMFTDTGDVAGFLRASEVAPYFDAKLIGTRSGGSATGMYVAEVPGHGGENVHGEFVLNRRSPAPCAGDCDGDGSVKVNELVTMVNIALGIADVSACLPGDANNDSAITIGEIVTAVTHALYGC